MAPFALTIFLSAFLLFQIQPLIGKYILPWYGGSPAVWTTCLLFFQLLLLVGYAYSHWISARLKPRLQLGLHLAVLAASLLLFPIAPDAEAWRPKPGQEPTWQILFLLTVNVGLPYALLSSTSPLIQRWFAAAFPGRSPYRLYALSNGGSLLALLSYPFLVEPTMAIGTQVTVWSAAYVVFILLTGWCGLGYFKLAGSDARAGAETVGGGEADSSASAAAEKSKPGWEPILLWLGLSAAASAMLLATTNQMCQEVAVVPFLWVVPLALYLLTFMLTFDSDKWYDRRYFGVLVGVLAPVACMLLIAGLVVKIWIHILVYSALLFVCCMCCHGELVRSKPHPRHLTLFYLVVAAGGALGGLFVALAAPRMFQGYWEYHLSLVGCVVLTLAAWIRGKAWEPYEKRPVWVFSPVSGMTFALVSALVTMATLVQRTGEDTLITSRNFYGILRLTQTADDYGTKLTLTHGRVVHGLQYIDGEKSLWPTAYYGPDSAIGLALKHHPRRSGGGSLRVGVVGLGAGTIAAYGRPGDYFRFYEINPEVIELSESHFTYCGQSAAEVEIVLGDGRIELERELSRGEPQGFDILVIDAFSSDAIPLHLLTTESFEVYRRHLKPDGAILFHISNQSLDLAPVIYGLASTFGMEAVRIVNSAVPERGVSFSVWAIVTSNGDFLNVGPIRDVAQPLADSVKAPLVWTDDFASLWQVLRF